MTLPAIASRRIFVANRDANGNMPIPQVLFVQGENRIVWSQRQPNDIPGHIGFEYREPVADRLFLVRHVVEIPTEAGTRLVGIWYCNAVDNLSGEPFADAVFDALLGDGTVTNAWAINPDISGAFCSDALEADGSAVAQQVRTSWPNYWRLMRPEDQRPRGQPITRTGRYFVPQIG